MKTETKHIPEHQQEQLKKVVDIIKETTYKNIWAEMIILFWSYARGDFVVRDVVSEWWGTRVYESDIDIMVITKKPTQEKNLRLSMEINEKIEKDYELEWHFTIEDIGHVNKMLEESRYFYIDIKNEWILLYDSKKYPLNWVKNIDGERRKEIQKEDFNMWFEDAKIFFWHYKFDFKNWDYKIGAFHLHQTTEKLMTAYLLVKTGYKPKTHDLEVIYRKIKEENTLFDTLFDLSNEKENYHFELLRKAYIEARYSKTYKITQEESKFLEDKILLMIALVEKLCLEELK